MARVAKEAALACMTVANTHQANILESAMMLSSLILFSIASLMCASKRQYGASQLFDVRIVKKTKKKKRKPILYVDNAQLVCEKAVDTTFKVYWSQM